MRNILAIARKELRGYFASPIGYIVVGLYAIVFGYVFSGALTWFVRQSMQAQMGGGPLNINQMVVRYAFMNTAVISLFMVPLITMRIYAEEKRSGTIELLMTSPVTDWQIILGKFCGALGLYLAMMAITLPHMAVLFVYGNPEWKPLLTGYLGMVLMGGSFLALGLFFSSLTRNQIVAGMFTFASLLLLWLIDWMASSAPSPVGAVIEYLSLTGHLEDFFRGVVDTRHLVYYLSFITFGLFLTARAVDTERWRG